MIITLDKLAKLTNSIIKGNGSCELENVASLEDASKGQISFVSNPKYRKQLKNTKASAVILTPVLAQKFTGNVLINDDPYLTFAKVVSIFHKKEVPKPFVHPSAVIAHDAIVSESANIGANVVIESNVTIDAQVVIGAGSVIGKNAILKKNVHLHSNVTLYADTQVGENSVIHSGAVIGADGFGFAPMKDKNWYKIEQVGNVIIGDDVDIGANTTIDRAAMGSTLIGNGVKLDNQIQIGHNVKIGDKTIMAGATVVAGSTKIGKSCMIGGAVAIGGHLDIVDNVVITGRSMVMKSISEAGMYSSGIALEENKQWRRNASSFRHLHEMSKKIKNIEKVLKSKNTNTNTNRGDISE